MTRKKECVRSLPQVMPSPTNLMVLLFGILQVLSPVITAVHAPSQRQITMGDESPPFRGPALSEEITPMAYRIHIIPLYNDPIENTTMFNGAVEIDVEIKNSDTISLHIGNGININNYTLVDTDGKYLDISISQTSVLEDITTIQSTSNLNGNYTVSFHYDGIFQEEFNGFYKSTYKKSESDTGVLFTTHFQATHARKAFPCFDEPHLKATFSIKIDVPDGYGALSNTPVSGISFRTISFETTVKMSTYLLAFIIYEENSYTYTSPVKAGDVDIQTWAQRSAISNGFAKYSQNVTPIILEQLEKYTNISYLNGNMKKIDQAAIPDFSAGAMENWGLVTYRESRLLFNEQEDSSVTKKSVAMIIGHELTHQWFGNLVTTKWWDATWLNEGFARYMQYLILSKIYPEWRMMDQLLVDQQMSVFLLDSVDNALPLTYSATTSTEIKDRFGTITYSKGASFLRMVSNAIGEEIFQEALRDYLSRYSFGSVIPKNLFDELDAKTPTDRKPAGFVNALETWTSQSGFPVVYVERSYTTRRITLSQKRFFADGVKEAPETLYYIPLIWSSKINNTRTLRWFLNDEDIEDELEMENWLLVHATGYYRVNYDEENWLTLMWTLLKQNRSMVTASDRAQLFDDAFSLAAAGYLPYNIAEYMMRCLSSETDIIPWVAVSRPLEKLELMLGNINPKSFYDYVRTAIEAIYEANGFSIDGSFEELVYRPTVLRWACRSNNRDCVQTALSLLNGYLQNGTRLDPNLKSVVLCYGIMYGQSSHWNQLWRIYEETEDENEKATLISALGCSTDSAIVKQFLRDTLPASEDQTSDFSKAFTSVLSHPKGIADALNFVIENYLLIKNAVSLQTYYNTMKELASHISSEVHSKELEKMLWDQFEAGEAEEAFVNEVVAIVKKNVDWVQKYADDAVTALERATKAEPVTTPSIDSTTSTAFVTMMNIQMCIFIILFTVFMNINTGL